MIFLRTISKLSNSTWSYSREFFQLNFKNHNKCTTNSHNVKKQVEQKRSIPIVKGLMKLSAKELEKVNWLMFDLEIVFRYSSQNWPKLNKGIFSNFERRSCFFSPRSPSAFMTKITFREFGDHKLEFWGENIWGRERHQWVIISLSWLHLI